MVNVDELLAKFAEGNRRALSRIISLVENRQEGMGRIMDAVYLRTGGAYRVGITGPPGAGKSTMVSKLVMEARKHDKQVGVIAVDPTSPFTGGALLGDRIRMQEIGGDPGVFVRSMATRGSLGGLAAAATDVADVMDAFGMDLIVTETVGVGQCELDIAEACYTTVVVLVPESGDAVQAMKAGLMEIADLLVMNKSDREGAERMAREIKAMLELRGERNGWEPPVLQTRASFGEGIAEVYKEIWRHSDFLAESGLLQIHRRTNVEHKIKELIEARLHEDFWDDDVVARLEAAVEEVLKGKKTPRQACSEILSASGK
ncbi:MAG: methylmalonyl Co-A mutase-associated GTPase MeaB [bacterium]|jgi:LAO/AO transport system kinase